jgi:hypothetical protein
MSINLFGDKMTSDVNWHEAIHTAFSLPTSIECCFHTVLHREVFIHVITAYTPLLVLDSVHTTLTLNSKAHLSPTDLGMGS